MTDWSSDGDEYQFYFEDGKFSVECENYPDDDCGVYFSITKDEAREFAAALLEWAE